MSNGLVKNLQKSVSIAVQNAFPYLGAVLDNFLTTNPYWQLAFYSAIGLYGVYMAVNQEEVNEVVRFINANPDKFRQEIVESQEFRKGFLLFIDQYLKQRLEKKKQILKKIFLDFTLNKEKEEYDIERLNNTLERISINGLEFMIFVNSDIIPAFKSKIDKELEKDQYRESDRSKEWWLDQLIVTYSIWEIIDKWLSENYGINSNRVKEMYGQPKNEGWLPDKQRRASTREREKRSGTHEAMTELVSLNILTTKVAGITYGGGGGTDYSLTKFGVKLLKLIDEVNNS